MAVIRGFQEEQRHLVLISQHNSMLNLLCPAAICMNANKNFVPLHNDSLHVKLLPYLVMMQFSVEVVINNRLASPSGVNAPVWEILDLLLYPLMNTDVSQVWEYFLCLTKQL